MIRLYRAFNTVIQMAIDRGFVVSHPSDVANAIRDSRLYDITDGLNYQWFTQRCSSYLQRHRQTTAEEEEEAKQEGRPGKDPSKSKRTKALRDASQDFLYSSLELVCKGSSSRIGFGGGAISCKTEDEVDGRGPTAEPSSRKKNETILCAFFVQSLGVDVLNNLREVAQRRNASSMIVVVGSKVRGGRRSIREAGGGLHPGTTGQVIRIQVFEEDELAYNISRHQSVPKHVPMTDVEVRAFLEQRKLMITQLPRILNDDPMVEYLDLPRGSIIRIERRTDEGSTYEMYRHVI